MIKTTEYWKQLSNNDSPLGAREVYECWQLLPVLCLWKMPSTGGGGLSGKR